MKTPALTLCCALITAACGGAVEGAPDTQAPSTPGHFTIGALTGTSVNLTWTAATDNTAVTAYVLSRNGTALATLSPSSLSYADTPLSHSTPYAYTLQASDMAGNLSPAVAITANTPGANETILAAPLALNEQPFGALTLVDEIDTATVAPNQQIPANVSSVAATLGKNARTINPGETARFMSYRIGAGKGLVAKQAYVLDIEYPDDVGRAMFVANRGADMVRGFATGKAIGDSRRTYTPGTLESIAYPHSGRWTNYRSLFYLHERFSPIVAERSAICSNRSLLPADGFDVTVFQTAALNDPRNTGVAVGKIRLYKVNDSASLAAPTNYPDSLPRRHVFWREEMADEAVSGSTADKRGVTNAIDWFTFKMDMGRALGFDTVGKDMMEWGANQGFDSGDSVWIFNAQPPLTNIWSEIVAQAAARDLYLMPYLEYAGSLGSNCAGTTCDKTPGNYKGLGFQHRSKKLFHGLYAGNGEASKSYYTPVSWAENKSADLTDPDTLTDLQKVVDKLLTQYKGQAEFLGVWLRMRQTQLPMSFSPETLARYNTDNPGNPRTLSQLQTDVASRASYYSWWYGKRRTFLLAIRDYARTQMGDNSLQVHFSPYPDEPVPRSHAPGATETSTPINLVTDEPTWWSDYAKTITAAQDPNTWYKWQWSGMLPATALSQSIHRNGLELFRKPQTSGANMLEYGHSTPPADPALYQNDEGVAMSFSFGNGLFTVDDASLLSQYNNASGGATLLHHYPLNEDNGDTYTDKACTVTATHASGNAFNSLFGYLSVAVERAGPYSTLAEARALANGNPVNIGYLESSSMSRGFPAYVRRFNQALLSLPALPATTVSGISSNSSVVVRKIASASGSYYAVINPTLQAQNAVTLTFSGAASVRDLLTQTNYASPKLLVDLYPGEVRTFKVP